MLCLLSRIILSNCEIGQYLYFCVDYELTYMTSLSVESKNAGLRFDYCYYGHI